MMSLAKLTGKRIGKWRKRGLSSKIVCFFSIIQVLYIPIAIFLLSSETRRPNLNIIRMPRDVPVLTKTHACSAGSSDSAKILNI